MSVLLIVTFLVLLCAGYVAGMTSGMFGLGGGMVIVPVLYLFFKLSGTATHEIMHVAVGTSLAVMVLTSLRAILAHYRSGNIDFRQVLLWGPCVAVGALTGSISSRWVHSDWLHIGFICFFILIILNVVLGKEFAQDMTKLQHQPPKPWVSMPVFTGIGLLSVWLGIGGSVMTVPFLRRAKFTMIRAAALAVALAPFVAIPGVIGYIWAGWNAPSLPAHSLGYVDLPAMVGLMMGTVLGVPAGVRLAKRLHDVTLARAYIAVLFIMLVVLIL